MSRLKVTVHTDTKIVEIYLSKKEKDEPDIQARLKKIYDEYRGTKYITAVFRSGDGELYDNTLALLAHNKRHFAEKNMAL